MDGQFVAYYRTSTRQQDLGIVAQKTTVQAYLNGGRWQLVGAFEEQESGTRADRPALAQAIQRCKLTGATLIIAKLDRLSRDVHFLTGLEKSGINFVCCDMPSANRMTIHILASVAQGERDMIVTRTKAVLAEIKTAIAQTGSHLSRSGRVFTRLGQDNQTTDAAEKGRRMGREARTAKAEAFATLVRPTILELQEQGLSLRAIAARLTEMNIRTARGGAWNAQQIKNILARAAETA
jgi:DNA invertase Pin-like site-specific DNA recombinase